MLVWCSANDLYRVWEAEGEGEGEDVFVLPANCKFILIPYVLCRVRKPSTAELGLFVKVVDRGVEFPRVMPGGRLVISCLGAPGTWFLASSQGYAWTSVLTHVLPVRQVCPRSLVRPEGKGETILRIKRADVN